MISGNGTNLQALIDACVGQDFPAEIVLTLSNMADAFGLQRASESGIKTVVIKHTDFKSRGRI